MRNDGKNAKNAGDGKHPSPDSHSSHPIIPPRGDYQTLHSFHKAEVVYDLTFRFAHKYLSRGDRTVDQMIQSARSGKKNILEGSKAALTSKETEIKLTNVGRASLEELLDDYRDYLRVREHREWVAYHFISATVRPAGMKGITCSLYGVTTSRTYAVLASSIRWSAALRSRRYITRSQGTLKLLHTRT